MSSTPKPDKDPDREVEIIREDRWEKIDKGDGGWENPEAPRRPAKDELPQDDD